MNPTKEIHNIFRKFLQTWVNENIIPHMTVVGEVVIHHSLVERMVNELAEPVTEENVPDYIACASEQITNFFYPVPYDCSILPMIEVTLDQLELYRDMYMVIDVNDEIGYSLDGRNWVRLSVKP